MSGWPLLRAPRALPSRLRVPLGYACGILLLVLARPEALSVGLGLVLACPGEMIRIWASGHIEKTQRLATGGPYAHTRNPLYVGSALLALGVAVAAWSLLAALALAVYLLAFYPGVIAEEANFLRTKFPEEYAAWSAAVPAFLPRLRPAGPQASTFRWDRVWRNREWQAVLAFPLLALLFYFRSRIG